MSEPTTVYGALTAIGQYKDIAEITNILQWVKPFRCSIEKLHADLSYKSRIDGLGKCVGLYEYRYYQSCIKFSNDWHSIQLFKELHPTWVFWKHLTNFHTYWTDLD